MYSRKKGVAPLLLSAEEKKRFIISGLENIEWEDVEKWASEYRDYYGAGGNQ